MKSETPFPKVYARVTASPHGRADIFTTEDSFDPFDVTGPAMSPERSLERAKFAATAINSHTDLLAALKAFACLSVSTCPHCDGNGLQYPEPCKDACHTCGGTGEVVSSVLPQDVKQARAAVERATP